MKAKIIKNKSKGTGDGKREKLATLLPLDTPILLQYFPIYACNFKCHYCTFSAPKEKRGFISNKVSMDIELFKKTIDEAKEFNNKIKVVRFVGMGEPLLHKQIDYMIKYTMNSGITDFTEILTNGSLLTKDLANRLIEADLSSLFISIQGTSEVKYKNICDFDINMNKFLDNIRYYFEHKKANQKLHIKIIDCALDSKEDEEYFYEMFGDVCDTIAVEFSGPIFPGVEYEKVLPKKNLQLTQFGKHKRQVLICPQPFFTMQINPDGNVVPCYSVNYPEILGNCYNEHIVDIWLGKKYNKFRFNMLDGMEFNEVCKKCNIIKHRFHPEDDLSGDVERLKQVYKEQ
jgi:radical SAM protein with 4Fe4S-binding SPASM domain